MPEALAPNVSVDDAAAATDNDAEAALYPGHLAAMLLGVLRASLRDVMCED